MDLVKPGRPECHYLNYHYYCHRFDFSIICMIKLYELWLAEGEEDMVLLSVIMESRGYLDESGGVRANDEK